MNESFERSPVQPGEILLGRFRVERVLGVGGMGVVVAARHLHLDSVVAIKFLLPEILANEEAVQRFAREALAAVRIKNEHISRVTDVGVLENGAPYMVMEYLDGSDLGAVLSEHGRLSIDESVDFVLQASEAIAEAHSLGIIHRDLKPANLFLVRRSDGSRIVKVLDFGISKMTITAGGGPIASMTGTASMMGSPLYMSPEQLNSARDVDVRSDIWSLGVILHELITGQLPFMAGTIGQACIAIVQGPPVPLRRARPDAPLGLEAVVSKCLEKDRAHRFSSVADLARALGEYAPPRARVSIERITHLLSSSGAPPISSVASPGAAVPLPRVETVAVSLPDATSPPRLETVLVTASGVQGAWGHTAGQEKPRRTRNVVIASAASFVVATSVVLLIMMLAPSRAAKTTTSAPASSALIELSPSAPIPVDSAQVEDHVSAPAEDIARDAVLEPVPAKTAAPALSPPKRNVGHSPSSPRSQPILPKRRDLPGSGLD